MFTLQLPTVHSTNGTDLPNAATTTRTLKKPRTRAATGQRNYTYRHDDRRGPFCHYDRGNNRVLLMTSANARIHPVLLP
jgi:hypothetical protein